MDVKVINTSVSSQYRIDFKAINTSVCSQYHMDVKAINTSVFFTVTRMSNQ